MDNGPLHYKLLLSINVVSVLKYLPHSLQKYFPHCLLKYFPHHPKQEIRQRSRSSAAPNLQLDEARLLALPVVVSLINLLLPSLFNLASWMEDYHSPSVRTFVAISRSWTVDLMLLIWLFFSF